MPPSQPQPRAAADVVLVSASLAMGGTERVLCTLANGWAAAGRSVVLVCLATGTPAFELHAAVRVISLGVAGRSRGPLQAIRANLRRVLALRDALDTVSARVVAGFGTEVNVLLILASVFRGWRVVVAERSNPRVYPYGRAWRALRRLCYRRADAIVVQTRAAAAFFRGARVCVVPNPVTVGADPEPADHAAWRDLAPFVLAVGRLVREKGFDLLLDAFAGVARERPQWHLVIAGEGGERADLERLRATLGLAARVHLPGAVACPQALMRECGLFVLPSRVEGFPNALLEAMACGCAVLACDCDSGPGEIVDDGVDGVLVPPEDAAALRDRMSRLMEDAGLRRRLGDAALAVGDRFSLPVVLAAWSRVLLLDAGTAPPAPPRARDGR